jgi:hypothetical protein
LENYAAAHNGTYGKYVFSPFQQIGLDLFQKLGLDQMKNAYSGEDEPSTFRAASAGQIGLEVYECDSTVVGYRVTGYGKDHMLITLEALDNVPADVRYTHDVSVANALEVRDAAMRFAAADNGVFSTDTCCDTNHDGKTLIELLQPTGFLLINPFEGQNTEPQDGLGLAWHGAVGYLGSDSSAGSIDVFTIETYDCDGNIMLTLSPFRTQYGEYVWSQAYSLRAAIETFAKSSGHYPHNLDVETTPAGKTVMDLYSVVGWEQATYVLNPKTQAHYTPTMGSAADSFAVAYQPIETAGVVTDYVITGRAMFDELVRLGPDPLP